MASEALGTQLVVGITMTAFVSIALPVIGWCWSADCTSTWHHEPTQSEAWQGSTWNGHELAFNDSTPGRICWPVLVNHQNGKAVDMEPGATTCQTVATAKDPNDAWHPAPQ